MLMCNSKSRILLKLIVMNRTILKKLSYIGAAIKEGQPLEGVKHGPQILRDSGLFRVLQNVYGVEKIKDYGDITFQSLPKEAQERYPINHMVNNLHKLCPVLEALSNKIQDAYDKRQKDQVILNVGGDHSIGSATIHAALKKNPDLKVIWVDAHADFVNPYLKKTEDQNYHGMPLSHICGVHTLPGFAWMDAILPYRNVVLIGIRDIDDDEFYSLKKHKVKAFTMDHIDKIGIGEVMTQAINYLDPRGTQPFHISYDIDAIDPQIANQTGTLYRGGLNHRQACHIVKRIANQRHLVSMDIVEINPDLQEPQERQRFRDEHLYAHNISKTVGMAADLVTSMAAKNLTL